MSARNVDEQLLRAEAVSLRGRVEAQTKQLRGLLITVQGAMEENAATAQESAVFANAVEGLLTRNRALEAEKALLEEKLERALADIERLERERLELVRPLGGPL